jgi:malonyl-CoA/methylmalonyl-CoA synthetase
MKTLQERIESTLRTRADATALIWDDETYTFADLDTQSAPRAAAVGAHGVRPSDRVAVGLPNSPELITTILAVLRTGAVLVPLNPLATGEEAAYLVEDSGARLVVAHDEQVRALRAAGVTATVVTGLESVNTATPALHSAADPEDPALIIYTSGTTDRPKGAVLSHRALLSNLLTVADAWEWTHADRLLLTLPCFHLHGLGLGVLTSLLVGSSLVLRPRFDVNDALDLLVRHECTMFFGVPTIYNRLVQLPAEAVRRADLHRMRLWVSGSAPLTPATHQRFRERFGYALMDRYGMTEAGFVLSTPYRDERRPGVVGRALPGIEVRLIDPERADAGELVDVATEMIGELVYRGPNLFSGYWGRPADTARGYLAGYFRSGDLAVCEPDGQYRIVGRRSVDIIKSRGFKISAVEIENCLQQHPAIAEVAVVGVPDADRGETVTAAITPVPGATLGAEDVRAFARVHLAPHKVPARVVFVAEIPRSGPGKFKKRELIAQLASRL